MKRFMTALAILGLLAAPVTALATALTWTGNTSSSWVVNTNWSPTSGYPGSLFAGDTALINVATNNPVSLTSSPSNSIASLDLDAAANDAVVSLNLQASLTVTSGTTVLGGDAGSNTATIQLTSGTFDPAALVLRGQDPAQTRRAFFDLDGGTLTAPDSLTLQGEADIDAEIDFNMSGGAVTVNVNASDMFDTVASIDMASTKTFTADSLTISVPDSATSYNSSISLKGAGTHVISNAVVLNGTSSAAKKPKLAVQSTGSDVTIGSLDLNGGNATDREAVLDIDQSVSVGTATTLAGYLNIDVRTGEVFDIDDATVDGATTVLTLVTPGTFQGDTLTIDAEAAGAARSFEKAGSGHYQVVGTAFPAVLVKGDQAAMSPTDAATLKVSAGTFSPKTIHFLGSTDATNGHAIADFDVSVTVTGEGTSAVDTKFEKMVDIDLAAGATFDTDRADMVGTDADLYVIGRGDGVSGDSKLKMSSFTPNDRPIVFEGAASTNGLIVEIGT